MLKIFVLMLQNKRFEKLCKRFGYKIVPIASKINWKLQKRTDIVGIDYHGDFIIVPVDHGIPPEIRPGDSDPQFIKIIGMTPHKTIQFLEFSP